MDWWIVKQLRAMATTDLREFVPDGYFENPPESLKLRDEIPNAAHYSRELEWGYLAGQLGRRLFFESTAILSARQVSACEVLMNLGMLAGAEAAQAVSQQLSIDAKAKGLPDGNAGAVAQQLRQQQLPTLMANVQSALRQYLQHLTDHEARPFASLLIPAQSDRDDNTTRMLPEAAVTHFKNLCSSGLTAASAELTQTLKRFLQTESAGGRVLGGAGFATRLAKMYVDDLGKRARIVVSSLKTAHADFGTPLAEGVDDQLVEMGRVTLSQQCDSLKGGFCRNLSRMGISGEFKSGFDHAYPLLQVEVQNQIRQHLWTLRNVPMKSPAPKHQADAPTMIFNGPVGAVQTGERATAHVQQHWTLGDPTALVQALQQLRTSALGALDLDIKRKEELVAAIDAAQLELKADRPSQGRILSCLTGVGAIVQTVGSAQSALDAVRAAAQAVGLPF